MQLKHYANAIKLNQLWKPSGELDKGLDWIIDKLANDKCLTPYTQAHPAPTNSEADKKQWLRAMLTLRPAGFFDQELFSAIDNWLSKQNQHRPMTDSANLLTAVRLTSATRLSIWQGDITTLKTDAIVNAANSQMQGCFQPFHACIDNAIHHIAGPRLREDCHTIIQLQGEEELTGTAKITRGYNLNARFVLHTVGPVIHKGVPLSAGDKQALANCYTACLELAAEQGEIESIAFCGISTGVFGFPKEEATSIAVATVLEWLNKHPQTFKQIIFNTFDQQATALYQRELAL